MKRHALLLITALLAGLAPLPATADEAPLRHALAELGTIQVEPERRTGYDRSDWPHWIDADGDCLDTRDEVLLTESLTPAIRRGCDIVSGTWRDRYTGENFSDPSALDIDHLVPLEEAYASGGADWPREKRAAYANDLGDPRALVAVSASANRSKGSKDPAEWLPPDPADLCPYIANWIGIKARWNLSMDESERVVIGNILSDCLSESPGPVRNTPTPTPTPTKEPLQASRTPDCRIKGNIGADGARLYHMPNGRWYARTKIDENAGERWFCSEDEARRAGWRRAGG